MKKILALLFFLAIGFLFIKDGYNNSGTPPAGRTNAPGESNCATSSCHNGAILSSPSFTVGIVGGGNLYETSTTYNMIVNLNLSSNRKGFSITALDGAGNFVGSFTLTNPASTSLTSSGGRDYVGHLNASSINAWTFQWTAPASYVGDITFYATGNVANGNNNRLGDLIYATTFVMQQAVVAPAADFTTNTTTICNGDTVIFSDASVDSVDTWNWDFGNGANPSTATGEGPHTVAYSSSASKDITLVVEGPGGTDTITKAGFVVVNPVPFISAGNDTTICTGESATLSATIGLSGYSWSPANGLDSTNVSSTVATPTATTTYTVVGTDANGCTNTDEITVSIQNGITTSISATDSAICENETTILTATGGTSYSWGPTVSLDTDTGSTVNAFPLSTTTYNVLISDGVCFAVENLTIVVQPELIRSVSPDRTICLGDTVQLMATGGTSYMWAPGGDLDDSTTATVIATPTATTTYTVLITNGECHETEAILVTTQAVNGAVAQDEIFSCTNSCLGQNPPTVQLEASGGVSYQWWPTTFMDDSSSATPILSSPTGSFPQDSIIYFVAISDGQCVDTQQVLVRWEYCLNIHENEFSEATMIYPTPSTDGNVAIWMPEASQEVMDIYIVNLEGRKVYTGTVSPGHQNINLDLSAIQSGVYILHMQSATHQVMKKVLLE